MSVLPSDILFAAGGLCLERYGRILRQSETLARGGEDLTESGVTRGSPGRFADRDGILRVAEANAPRITWADLNGDGVAEAYLLSEPPATNIALHSNFDAATNWSLTRATLSLNQDAAPDGAISAARLIEDATASATHVLSQNATITANGKFIAAFHLKAATRTWVRLQLDEGAGTNVVRAWFNLSTGTVGTTAVLGSGTLVLATIVPSTMNGYYDCILVGSIGGGATSANAYCCLATGDAVTAYSGDGASYVSIWGAQILNNTALPGTYVTPATTGASQTRAQDLNDFTAPVPVQDFSVFYCLARPPHADAVGTTGAFPGVGEIGTVAPRCGAFFDSVTRQIVSIVRNSGDSQSSAAIPAGQQLFVLAQYRNLTTAPGSRLDVGSGLTAWNNGGAAAVAFTAFGDRKIRIGYFDVQLAGGVRLMCVARGLQNSLADFRSFWGI